MQHCRPSRSCKQLPPGERRADVFEFRLRGCHNKTDAICSRHSCAATWPRPRILSSERKRALLCLFPEFSVLVVLFSSDGSCKEHRHPRITRFGAYPLLRMYVRSCLSSFEIIGFEEGKARVKCGALSLYGHHMRLSALIVLPLDVA